MSQQSISMEDAFPTVEKRCIELFRENLILRAQVDILERQLAEQQQPSPDAGHPVEPSYVEPGQNPSTM